MKNKYIKFCDKHKLSSGVMREMLIHGKPNDALKSIGDYKERLRNKVQACNDLCDMIVVEKGSSNEKA